MAAGKSTTKQQQLLAENRRLASENSRLQKQLKSLSLEARGKRGKVWKSALIVLCVGLAGALLVVGNILFWAGQTVTNTDRYVETMAPLIENTTIQQGIAAYATSELYKTVDINALTTEVLPPRASFLAQPLAEQIQTHTKTVIERILASTEFQQLWIESQQRAHQRLITLGENYQGDGTIDVSDIYNRISQRLSDTRLSFLANRNLPENVGSITVVSAPWLPTFHTIVTNIDVWQTLAVLALVLFSALAIWLSRNRRKTAIIIGWTFVGLMFMTLLAIRLAIQMVAGKVDPAYSDAAEEATRIILNPLRIQSITLLLIGLLVVVIAWIGSQSKAAAATRGRIQELLSGNIHKSLFAQENGFTRWVGRHRNTLQWLAVALTGLIFFAITLRPAAIVAGALALLLVVAILYVLAAPSSKR